VPREYKPNVIFISIRAMTALRPRNMQMMLSILMCFSTDSTSGESVYIITLNVSLFS
jgi:hypothetical protein